MISAIRTYVHVFSFLISLVFNRLLEGIKKVLIDSRALLEIGQDIFGGGNSMPHLL